MKKLIMLIIMSSSLWATAEQNIEVLTTINGQSETIAWCPILGEWQYQDKQLIPTDENLLCDSYGGECSRIFLPCKITGDFDFSCEFFMPGPDKSYNSTGAGGPVVYFHTQDNGSTYAFRYVNYWGTSVMHKKDKNHPWISDF